MNLIRASKLSLLFLATKKIIEIVMVDEVVVDLVFKKKYYKIRVLKP